MKRLVILAAANAILFLNVSSSLAIRPDECEQQRATYPKNWNDVSKDRALFKCQSRYFGPLTIRLGAPDNKGRSLMSLVPVGRDDDIKTNTDSEHAIHRMWLDSDQARRLKEGQYFGTVVRTENSCWVRGDLSGDPVFLMDNTDPPADSQDASAFYNKAPRVSSFKGQAFFCEPIK
jgi:hypothetical protein